MQAIPLITFLVGSGARVNFAHLKQAREGLRQNIAEFRTFRDGLPARFAALQDLYNRRRELYHRGFAAKTPGMEYIEAQSAMKAEELVRLETLVKRWRDYRVLVASYYAPSNKTAYPLPPQLRGLWQDSRDFVSGAKDYHANAS